MNSTLHLLLVDDDELDRLAVKRALRQSQRSYEITEASTAADALRLASKQHFDAILLDYRMPDQNGLDVLRQLRGGQYEGVAVIMLSHQDDEALAEHCLEAGAQDFLLKDEVNSRRLVRAVHQAKQRYLIEDALLNSREQLRQLAESDPLTGLTNRRGFDFALAAAIARVRRGKDRLGLLLLDLDDFKSVNDTMGHSAGDVLLIEIAQRLSETVRDSDILCRLGGDEFAVLITNFEKDEQTGMLADRIIAKLQEPILIGAVEHRITTSIGIALLDHSDANAADLLKLADIAMYRAKQEGRNTSRFYSAELQEHALSRANMKRDMRRALERDEFKVYFQAQIIPSDGSLGGMEALLRWHHPHLGILAPAAFMSIAEETRLIVDIGNWVLRESCRQLKDWQSRLPATSHKLNLAVNLSATQIKYGSLRDTVLNVLAETQFEANKLELEITESALIEDTSTTSTLLSSIVALGVSLSLDDFGTGYSSLEHLRLFPISVLKIDRSFVSTIGDSTKSEQLLEAIILFAKTLEMKVIAEGVETREQADFCARNGCDLLQGYYYSHPIPANEFESVFLLRQKDEPISELQDSYTNMVI